MQASMYISDSCMQHAATASAATTSSQRRLWSGLHATVSRPPLTALWHTKHCVLQPGRCWHHTPGRHQMLPVARQQHPAMATTKMHITHNAHAMLGNRTRHAGSHSTAVRLHAAAATGPSVDTTSGEGPLEMERLVTLLERMLEGGQVPEPEWCDMMYAATYATSHTLSLQQRVRMVQVIGQLRVMGMQPDDAWLADVVLQADVKQATPWQVLGLWGGLALLQRTPHISWLASTMSQLASGVDQLSAEQAGIAICALARLLGLEPGCEPLVPDNEMPQQTSTSTSVAGTAATVEEARQKLEAAGMQLGTFLDILAIRMVEADMEEVESEQLAMVATALTQTCRHMPPYEWVQALSDEVLRTDLDVQQCSSIAVALAACRCVPDAVLAPQLYLLTGAMLGQLPANTLCDVVWAAATWHVGKDGGPLERFDFRAPARWWDEWCQETGKLLQAGRMSKEDIVKLVWSLSVLRVRPPQAWLLLLTTSAYKHLQAGAFTGLELLYLSRSADMWYGMLLGVESRNLPVVDGVVARPQPMRAVGQEESYQPPDQLAALVRDANQLMAQSQLPVGWRRINIRFPPYSLPAREEVSQSDSDVDDDSSVITGSDARQAWLQSVAAQRIYGPLTPPAWR